MQRNASIASEVDDRAALIASLTATVDTLTQQVAALTQQVEWFRRQLFGTKSERVVASDPQQMALGAVLPPVDGAPAPAGRPVAAHTRKAAQRDAAAESESLPFFDESKVPIIEIGLSTPEIEALSPDQYEVIGEKVSYRLAQQPGSYTVLKFTRPVIKRRDTQAVVSVPAPSGVIEGSRADVSLLAGLLVDKFVYHAPLYRQHQKLTDAGVRVSRPWLTQLTQQVIRLLMPIHEAQWASIRASRVIAMDETGIKAGRDGPGKMHQGYYWPVHGDREEICFIYANSRRHEVVEQVLGRERPPDRVLLSDGYAAYEAYARKTGIAHAQCWAHARREFFDAQAADREASAQALEMIRAIYAVEERIRTDQLGGESKRAFRHDHAKPIVAALRPRAPCRAGSVPGRPRRADRHQPSGTQAARDPDGSQELAVLLDRSRRQAGRHHPEPAGDGCGRNASRPTRCARCCTAQTGSQGRHGVNAYERSATTVPATERAAGPSNRAVLGPCATYPARE